jgi:hypothetical protein
VITEWCSFLIILWRFSQRAFSKSKLFNQPGLALRIGRGKEKATLV